MLTRAEALLGDDDTAHEHVTANRPDRAAGPEATAGLRAEPAYSAAEPAYSAPEPAYSTSEPTHSVGANGLPRRVRQASLATQLRTPRPATQAADSSAEAAAPPRSPETVRATMTALQQGWTRGRGAPDPKEYA
jgi:hypothetical protein